MELSEALNSVAHMHAQFAKTAIYRGSRPLPVFLSACVGAAAATVQPVFVGEGDGLAFVKFWSVVAVVAGTIASIDIIRGLLTADEGATRRRTREVVAPLVAAGGVGAVLTICLGGDPGTARLLPGLWALAFGLGLMGVRSSAPRGAGWVALHYLIAGALLLSDSGAASAFAGWRVGWIFGVGQAAAALVMQLDLQRGGHGTHAETQG